MARVAIKQLFAEIKLIRQDLRILQERPRHELDLRLRSEPIELLPLLELPPTRRLYSEAPVFVPCAQAGVAPNGVRPVVFEGTGSQIYPTLPESDDLQTSFQNSGEVKTATTSLEALNWEPLEGDPLVLPTVLPGFVSAAVHGAEPGPKPPRGSGKADVDSSEPNWETLPTARSLSLPLPFHRKSVVNESSMQFMPNPSVVDYSRFDHIVLSEDESEGDYESISDEEVFAYQEVPEEVVPAQEDALLSATAEEPEQEVTFSWDEVEQLMARQRFADLVTVLSVCPAYVPKLRGIIPALEGMSRDCAGTDLKSSLQLRVKAQLLAAVCDGDRAEVATLTSQLQRI